MSEIELLWAEPGPLLDAARSALIASVTAWAPASVV